MDKITKNEVNILDSIFINVNDENKQSVIQEVKNSLFGSMSVSDECISVLGQKFIEELLNCLPTPYTIIHENSYVDRSFRDTYYMYFSNQHFEISRYSRRFSFFTGTLSYSQYLDSKSDVQNNFVGTCVINPLGAGLIGRTLIDPKYIVNDVNSKIFMRTSEYTVNILGRQLKVNAFPFRMQDQETMSCAEVTLLNIIEHYANSYVDYKIVNPSEIIEHEQIHSHERVLPSKGITYPILTKVLADFGFSPRLYNLYAIRKHNYSKVSPNDELRRWLHYYTESGIPVALNLNPVENYGSGHSVICIGHGEAKENLKNRAKQNELLLWNNIEDHPIINSADFFDDYIIVDDNQFLYQLRNFSNISIYPGMHVVNLAVPLYKRMFLDAPDAADTIVPILQHKEYGISAWAGEYLKPNEEVVIRLFMASSRSFKNYRVSTLKGLAEKMIYSNMRLPRFIWVCELYTLEGYDNFEAFGEIVIDATSAANRGHRSLVMMHYPDVITIRNPEDKEPGFENQYNLNEVNSFVGYSKNLTGYG